MAFVEVTKKDNIAIVTMNRPEALNALNKAVFADFEAALDQVEFDDDVYVIIITGSGRSFMDTAMEMAEKICKNAQKAIRVSKLAIRRGIDCDISTAVSYEALAFATCFGTEDQKEGMQAFLEKRKEKHFKNK